MKDPYQIILKPLITEKSTILRDKYVERPGGKKDFPKYAFVVDIRASKPEIRQAAEELFDLKGKILNINTMKVRGKPKGRLFQFQRGRQAHWKKAIITVKEGTTIQVCESI